MSIPHIYCTNSPPLPSHPSPPLPSPPLPSPPLPSPPLPSPPLPSPPLPSPPLPSPPLPSPPLPSPPLPSPPLPSPPLPSPQNASDDRDCENKLVLLLGYDQFQFIKTLFKNRWTVLYCTLLAKTESTSEREAIEEEMRADPEKERILKVSVNRCLVLQAVCVCVCNTICVLCA